MTDREVPQRDPTVHETSEDSLNRAFVGLAVLFVVGLAALMLFIWR